MKVYAVLIAGSLERINTIIDHIKTFYSVFSYDTNRILIKVWYNESTTKKKLFLNKTTVLVFTACSEKECEVKFMTMTDLRNNLEKTHEYHIDIFERSFTSRDVFMEWLRN